MTSSSRATRHRRSHHSIWSCHCTRRPPCSQAGSPQQPESALSMGEFLERIGVELPLVQAGMGGGLAGHELAAAVSGAGGLGTIGFLAPDALRREVAAARPDARRLAANLLLPFAHQAHFDAASDADVDVTFWGRPRRRTTKPWIHQCGSVEEALAARAAGADA